MWRPGKQSKVVLEKLRGGLKFLEGLKKVTALQLDSDQSRHDVDRLQLMFPDLDRDRVIALYLGFGGNFETSVEMLILALAEAHHRVNIRVTALRGGAGHPTVRRHRMICSNNGLEEE